MTEDNGLSEEHRQDADEPVAVRRGIDRRSLIKRAAAAGAVAWTAPVIFDSLASPAAAGTCGTIYRVEIRMNVNCASTSSSGVGGWVSDEACTTSDYAVPPAQYTETVVNLSTGQEDCITMSGTCSATATGTATATLTTTGCAPGNPVTGCSTPLQFLGAGQYGRYKDDSELCIKTPYNTSINPAGDGAITWVSGSQVEFAQPVSDKAAASGAWQFVVGCSCSFP